MKEFVTYGLYFLGMFHGSYDLSHVILVGEVQVAELDSDTAFEVNAQDQRVVWLKSWHELPVCSNVSWPRWLAPVRWEL